jgi:flagellin-like hook-associated protein FlgL
MQNNPKISPSLADGVFQLQRYRNLVAGNTQTIVAVHDAINFIDNVEKAVDLLETALNSA